MFRGPGTAPAKAKTAPPILEQVREPTSEDLEYAKVHGSFDGTNPSELFLKMYWHSLQPIEKDPTANVCSPKFAGTTGKIPLTIISVIPDIMAHYYNLIVSATYEVLLATNLWKNSTAAQTIANALRELSKRCIREGRRVSVKMLFLRFSVKHVLYPRLEMDELEWSSSAIGLPKKSEMPNVDLRIIKYHNVPMGTFHPKFLVVDRRQACLNSCNIQDNANFEMMGHFEGGIVDNVVDFFRASWDPECSVEEFAEGFNASGDVEPYDWAKAVENGNARIQPREGETKMQALTRNLNWKSPPDAKALHPDPNHDHGYQPYFDTSTDHYIPMALVNRKPFPGTLSDPIWDRQKIACPQNEAWLAGFRYAKKEVFIQTPDFNTEPVIEATVEAVRRGVRVVLFLCLGYNDLGEMMPYQGGHNDYIIPKLYSLLQESFTTSPLPPQNSASHAPSTYSSAKELLQIHWYVSRDTIRPIHTQEYVRSAHIKLMIVDRAVGIMGSGNQDTQSWYHSQEINVMVDDSIVCGRWWERVTKNQNSADYGRVGEDGWWREPRKEGSREGEGKGQEGNDGDGRMGREEAYGPEAGLWTFGRVIKKTASGLAGGMIL